MVRTGNYFQTICIYWLKWKSIALHYAKVYMYALLKVHVYMSTDIQDTQTSRRQHVHCSPNTAIARGQVCMNWQEWFYSVVMNWSGRQIKDWNIIYFKLQAIFHLLFQLLKFLLKLRSDLFSRYCLRGRYLFRWNQSKGYLWQWYYRAVGSHWNIIQRVWKVKWKLMTIWKLLLASFCVAYMKCVATLWHNRIYLSTRVERLSRGLVSHTCTHCGPFFFSFEYDSGP